MDFVKAAVVTRTWRLDEPVSSAQQVHAVRNEIGLVLQAGEHYGVGVVSPQPVQILGDPSFDDVVRATVEVALPKISAVGRDARGRTWGQVHALFGEGATDRWASALLEAAVIDLDCRESGKSWLDVLGAGECEFQTVGSLVGGRLSTQPGVSRYRIKVSTKIEMDFSRLSILDAPVLLDFNGDSPSLDSIAEIVDKAQVFAEVAGVEQAWSVGDFVRPSELRQLGLATSHDESLRSISDLRNAIRYDAIDIAALKPARCGGFAVVREMARRARDASVGVYVGGFFESPLARYRNYLLASSLSAGPSDVLDTTTGGLVKEHEAERERSSWVELAQQQGEWFKVGG